MGRSMSELQIKFFTYLVMVLITVLSIMMVNVWSEVSAQRVDINEMPNRYVRLERYTSDQTKLNNTLMSVQATSCEIAKTVARIEGRLK